MMADTHIDSSRGINHSGIIPKTDHQDNSALQHQTHPYPATQDVKGSQNDTEIVTKLKKQNAKLREELKQLSEQLSMILEKQKAKRPEKPVINQDLATQELKKELENAQKQIQIYSKDIKTLKNRIEFTYAGDRVANLENALTEKSRVIEKLTDEKKTLDRINREQEKQLNELKEEYKKSSNISAYTEEIRHLKLKLREVEERETKNEKMNQKKHEYFLLIEQKYRELCQQYGIDPVHSAAAKRNASVDPSHKGNAVRLTDGKLSPQHKISNTRSDASLRSHPKLRPSDDYAATSYTDDKFKELQNAIKILKKAHLTSEKKYKMDLDQMKARTSDLEIELKDTAQKLREKEKESNIMNSRMNEMKRTIKTSLLPALEDDHNHSKGNIGGMSSAKKRQFLNGTQPLGETRKDERGKPSATDKEFSDQALLKDAADNKIAGFKVWYTNTNIMGIQATYRDNNGKAIEGSENVSAAMKSQYKEDEVSLSGMDYVKEICGFLDKNEKYVQALIFTSAKGESKRIGNSTPDSKLFKLDINEYEYPTILYGAIEFQHDANQHDKENGSFLTKIGVVIRSHAVEEDIHHKEEDERKQNDSLNSKRVLVKSKPSSQQVTK